MPIQLQTNNRSLGSDNNLVLERGVSVVFAGIKLIIPITSFLNVSGFFKLTLFGSFITIGRLGFGGLLVSGNGTAG